MNLLNFLRLLLHDFQYFPHAAQAGTVMAGSAVMALLLCLFLWRAGRKGRGLALDRRDLGWMALAAVLLMAAGGGTKIVVGSLNGIRFADQFAGATADVQVAACLAALPAGGGTCDARGLGASAQQWAATVTVNAGQTLQFDPATPFQPATASVNFFIPEPDAIIRGFTLDCSTQGSYSGTVFLNDTSQFYKNGGKTALEDITIKNVPGNSSCGNSAGTALKFNSTSASTGVSFVDLRHWRVWGLLNGVLLTSSAPSTTGFVNDNKFIDLTISNAGHCIHLTDGGGLIQGNQFLGVSCEKDSSGTDAFLIDGSGGAVSGNLFWGNGWDYTGNSVQFNSGSSGGSNNYLVFGHLDGAVSDSNNTNDWQVFTGTATSQAVFNSTPIVNGSGINGPGQLATTNNSSTALNVPNGSGVFGVNLTAGGFVKGANFQCVEGSAPSGIASSDIVYCDSTTHRWRMINNNGSANTVAGLLDNLGAFATGGTIAPAVIQPNGVTVVNAGVCALVAKDDVTGQTNNVGSRQLIASATAGRYVMHGYTVVTTAAGVSSTLPNLDILYTDSDSNVSIDAFFTNSSTTNIAGTANSAAQSGNAALGNAAFFAKSGTAISWKSTNYASNAANVMTFAAHVWLEYCGS